jgi:hypothetical protein
LLCSFILFTVIKTLFTVTFLRKTSFFSFLSIFVSVSCSIAGFILFNKPVIFPRTILLHAPIIAPQFVWPSTTISLEPAILQASSMLPKISSFKIFPAIRMLRISPNPWSNINSAEVLESIQLKIAAKGN